MTFGGIGRAFMDDIIFQRLWISQRLEEDKDDNGECDDNESVSDIRKLFPKKGKGSKKDGKFNPIAKTDPPEWLAAFVGVFFVAGIVGIASYQAYKSRYKDELSYFSINIEDIAHDPLPLEQIYNKIYLPRDLAPESYVLYLYPNLEKKSYTGLIKIKLHCKHNTTEIILHSGKHKIRKAEVTSEKHGKFKVLKYLRNTKQEMLILKLDKELINEQIYNLMIGFGNALTYDVSNGIYMSDYKDGDGKSHTMVSTDLEPRLARRVFPCYDEPDFKATFQTIIQHDKSFIATSNMPLRKQVKTGEDNIESHFKVTPRMSTYLFVFIVTQYEYKGVVSKHGIKVRVYAPRGRLSETGIAQQVGPLAVDYYGGKFGMKFSLPKLDLSPMTQLASAADETWGNIIFLEDYLLFDSSTGSTPQLELTAKTISHEIAHQWFGDLVTMKKWNDLWLKESFAEYLEDLPVQKYYPSWDLETSFYSSIVDAALTFDASKYTHPIYSSEADPEKLESLYDAITYQKGAAVIGMLGNFLGNDLFFKGVHVYLNRYKYSNANATQFWEAISEVAPDLDVVAFMNSWVKQSGFPLITVTLQNGTFSIEQKPYVYQYTNNTKELHRDRILWHVPISIKHNNGINISKHTLKQGSELFDSSMNENDVKHMWYKANYGASGCYRVNYDDKNWNNLLRQMNANHEVLPAIDRASLLSDIANLAIFNYQSIKRALDFTQYLNKEHHYVPWGTGMSMLTKIHSVFHTTKLKHCVERYLLKKVKPVIDYLNSYKTHSHIQKHLISRMLAIAVAYDEKSIVAELNNKFLKWVVSDGRTELPGTIRSLVFETGIKYGQKYEWDYLFKQYKKASSTTEQQLILMSLASTEDEYLLKRFVNYALNPKLINPSQKVLTLRIICRTWKGRKYAWDIIKKEWNSIYEKNHESSTTIHYLLDACLKSGNTEADLKEAQEFFNTAKIGPFGVYENRIIEHIKQNIIFVKQKDKITEWFQKEDPQCLK